MQAILIRYIPATNTRGFRIKASCAAGTLTIPHPSSLSGQAAYRVAAEALATKLGWTGPHYGALIGGCLPNGGYCFVFDNASGRE